MLRQNMWRRPYIDTYVSLCSSRDVNALRGPGALNNKRYLRRGGVRGNPRGIRCGMTGLTGRGSLLKGTDELMYLVRPVDVRLKRAG